jgi:acetate kinase
MIILVSNVGSSSYKFQLFDMTTERVLARGGVERIGNPPSRYRYSAPGMPESTGEMNAPDHLAAIAHALAFLLAERNGVRILAGLDHLDGVGFKTVFAKGVTSSAIIDETVIAAMEAYIPVVPVHNPAYIASIRAFERLSPSTPRIAVFETWFHETIPDYAREFGVPRSWVREHATRRYGFHGASHRYISQRVPQLLSELGLMTVAPESLRVISCHLGGSSSLCAIRGGKSVDTTMGFSAQSGVLQGTRCGDMDPFVPLYMMGVGGLSLEEVERALMKDAGLAGISGVGSDMRDIVAAASNGNADAQLALDAFHYGVKKAIGAYVAALGGVDALAFTGGIGEKGSENRAPICEGLERLGIELDPEKNQKHTGEGNIARDGSRVAILVIPANEEIIVARESARLIREARHTA